MRKLVFVLMFAFMGLNESVKAQVTVIGSGMCGDSLTWVLTSDSVLTISGSGAMANFNCNMTFNGSRIMTKFNWDSDSCFSHKPIRYAVIGDSVTTVGSHAFCYCCR